MTFVPGVHGVGDGSSEFSHAVKVGNYPQVWELLLQVDEQSSRRLRSHRHGQVSML
jgi:hypothetical protein